ncbi:MAG: efflux RND transporter periplasmic adaptor subunit [Chloroflexota bacterium]
MKPKTIFNPRGIFTVVMVSALLLTACGAVQAMGTGSGDDSPNHSTGNIGLVTQITTTTAVETSGTVAASQQASLFWKTTGQVAQVLVRPGQPVRAGDVLMTLAFDSAPANVISAQADQIGAQEALDSLLAPSAQAIAAAEKSLADAHTTLDKAHTTLESELSRARSAGDSGLYDAYEEAGAALEDAQDALPLATADTFVQAYYRAVLAAERSYRSYQAAQDDADEAPDSADLALRVQQTQAAYESAQAEKQTLARSLDDDDVERVDELALAQVDFDAAVDDFVAELDGSNAHQAALVLNTARAAYRSAAEALAEAQLDLYHCLTEADPADVSAAQARLDAAQATLDTLSIVAPFDGEVLAVNYQVGDRVTAEKAALVLANRRPLRITAQVDESEIFAVKLADRAEIVLDSLPGATLSGIVDLVNPVGQTLSGVVKYTVEIVLDETDLLPLLGATADVTIFTGEPAPALAVPVTAVQSDASGEYVYRLLADGSAERVPVVSGSLQGDLVLVDGNLQAGDVVQLVQSSSASSSSMGIPLFGGR